MDSKHTSAKECQFQEWVSLGQISVDLQNNLQNCMRVGFNWVFSSFVRTHSSGDHGDQPWAFDVEVIDY
jgi:hypothetical protein